MGLAALRDAIQPTSRQARQGSTAITFLQITCLLRTHSFLLSDCRGSGISFSIKKSKRCLCTWEVVENGGCCLQSRTRSVWPQTVTHIIEWGGGSESQRLCSHSPGKNDERIQASTLQGPKAKAAKQYAYDKRCLKEVSSPIDS